LPDPKPRILLAADFTIQPFADAIENNESSPVEPVVAPFGQVSQVLLDPTLGLDTPPDYLWVWTRPEAAVPSFAKLARFEPPKLMRSAI
jgi:hypothetical protein